MSPSVQQSIILLMSGIGLISITWIVASRRILTIRFALGWMTLGIAVSLSSFTTSLLPRVGQLLGMTPTGFLLVLATVVLMAVCFQLSVTISVMQKRLNNLVQQLALRSAEEST